MTLKLQGTNTVATPGVSNDGNDGVVVGTSSIDFSIAGASKATLNSSGNLGIGTTSPSGKLNLATGASTACELRLTANSTGSGAGDRGRFNVYSARNDGTAFNAGYIDIDRSSGTADEAHITFNVNGGSGVGEKARITKYGTLLVAITSQEEPGNGNTTEGTSLKWDGRYFHSMPGTWGCINRNDSDGTLMVFAREGTHVGHISVGSSSTAYNTTSDYRLKENEVIITDGITRLKQLKPYQFNWKTDSTNTKLDGFFAHEVSSIVPEAITGTKDGVYDKDDDDANIKKGDPLYQGIDQSKLVPLLTAALQEAIGKIEVLETKVAAMEGS